MKVVNLIKKEPDYPKIDIDINRLMSNEFCHIKIHSFSNLNDLHLGIIQKAAKLTTNLSISLPLEDLKNVSQYEIFEKTGARTLCLRVKTNPEKFAKNYHIGIFHSGDRDLIEFIEPQIRQLLPGKNFALEFENEPDFRILGSTITYLHRQGIQWVLLNPGPEITNEFLKKYRDLFDFLRMQRCYKLNIYFDFFSQKRNHWQLQTLNTFSGLREVHIDLSNRCTHSCRFCGLYSPEAQKLNFDKNNLEQTKAIRDLMSMEIAGDKALDIINNLPFDTDLIQFGGAGDPLMHPQAVELIIAARSRGYAVEMLSNMEYLDEEKIDLISQQGATYSKAMRFIVNISGGSAETYTKTRPKQTAKTFEKITTNLKRFIANNRSKPESHVSLTLMCVVNSLNYDKLIEFSQYAIDIGAQAVWFKPVELHADYMKPIMIQTEFLEILKTQLSTSIELLDKNNIYIQDRNYCEQIIRQ